MSTPGLPDARREQILAILAAEGSARVTALADRLGVTPVTVRRDIAQLADDGLVDRVHGGASLAGQSTATGSVPPSSAGAAREGPAVDGGSTVGIVVPSMEYYWPGVLAGARAAAAEHGVRLVLGGSAYRAEEDERQLHRLVEEVGVDGLLAAPDLVGPSGDDLRAWLAGLDVPVVLLERSARPPRQEPMESVATDHALGASLAVEHLAGLGHRRIAVAGRPSPTLPALRAGWRASLHELGLPDSLDLDLVNCAEPGSRESVDRALDALLEAGVTAVLVHADPEAIALLERCDERGVSVPGDLSVIAYDDEVAEIVARPITAVRPPRITVGRMAVELVARRLSDPDRPVHRVVLAPKLRIRSTTGPPPA